MAPSPGSNGITNSDKSTLAADKAPARKTQQQTTPTIENGSEEAKEPKITDGVNGKPRPAEPPKDGKLSGKDLKAKAKAEKAARRAQDKQKQQAQPNKGVQGDSKKDEKKESGRRGSTTAKTIPAAQSSQHKRTGSMSSKSLPTRSAEPRMESVAHESPKEEKRVALFEHLYGLPRRTTIVGVGKDVHPAVLALGLQMNDYTICGSTARCAATLLVFRSVCLSK